MWNQIFKTFFVYNVQQKEVAFQAEYQTVANKKEKITYTYIKMTSFSSIPFVKVVRCDWTEQWMEKNLKMFFFTNIAKIYVKKKKVLEK